MTRKNILTLSPPLLVKIFQLLPMMDICSLQGACKFLHLVGLHGDIYRFKLQVLGLDVDAVASNSPVTISSAPPSSPKRCVLA